MPHIFEAAEWHLRSETAAPDFHTPTPDLSDERHHLTPAPADEDSLHTPTAAVFVRLVSALSELSLRSASSQNRGSQPLDWEEAADEAPNGLVNLVCSRLRAIALSDQVETSQTLLPADISGLARALGWASSAAGDELQEACTGSDESRRELMLLLLDRSTVSLMTAKQMVDLAWGLAALGHKQGAGHPPPEPPSTSQQSPDPLAEVIDHRRQGTGKERDTGSRRRLWQAEVGDSLTVGGQGQILSAKAPLSPQRPPSGKEPFVTLAQRFLPLPVSGAFDEATGSGGIGAPAPDEATGSGDMGSPVPDDSHLQINGSQDPALTSGESGGPSDVTSASLRSLTPAYLARLAWALGRWMAPAAAAVPPSDPGQTGEAGRRSRRKSKKSGGQDGDRNHQDPSPYSNAGPVSQLMERLGRCAL